MWYNNLTAGTGIKDAGRLREHCGAARLNNLTHQTEIKDFEQGPESACKEGSGRLTAAGADKGAIPLKTQPKQKKQNILLGTLFVLLAAAAVYVVFQVGMMALERDLGTMPGSSSLPDKTEIVSSGTAVSSSLAASSVPDVGEKEEASAAASAPLETESSVSKAASAEAGIFQYYDAAAAKKVENMTLEEKIGQLFIFRCPSEGAVQAVKDYHPGGYMLFGADFKGKTKEQVTSAIQSYQSASAIPMAIAVDEEGGTVVRVSSNPNLSDHRYQSPQQVYANGGMNAVYNDAAAKSKLLLSLGINLNFAPVADVSTNPKDFIYDRSFGQNAGQTANYVKIVVDAMNSQKLSCTLKHFPGYGNNLDTHTGIAYDERSLKSFQQSDFLPFEAGIDAGAECVLVSHNIVKCMDPQRPASLSPEVHRILREELGFSGIVMTDDLIMDAIRDYTEGENPAVMAFTAGNDVLLSSNMEEDYQTLLSAAQDGTISEADIDERVTRILAWKYDTAIMK